MDMSHCSNVVMQKIINYLFGGKIELQDLSLTELVKLMNMASMMFLNELLTGTQDFVLGFLPFTGVNCGSLPELVEAFMLAEQFQLKTIVQPCLLTADGAFGWLTQEQEEPLF